MWHRTVRCRTGQALFTVGCAFWWLLQLLRELSAHYSLQATVGADRCAASRCSAWCTGQSDGTPDSPVNYSGAALLKLKGEEFEVVQPWCTGHCQVAHRTVRCARPGFSLVSFAPFFLNPNLIFILVCVEPLCTYRIYNLEITS
jgi:hypothetical protein